MIEWNFIHNKIVNTIVYMIELLLDHDNLSEG